MKFLSSLSLALILPAVALAHGGHEHEAGSFASGAAHPVSGADHVLAMVVLGLLAAQVGGRALWALPAAFVGAMIFGGVVGAAGAPFPGVEPMILASGVILGALVALALKAPLPVLIGMSAIFGAAHGWAHGAEGPAAGLAIYALGFAAMTAALHGAGILVGRALPALALRAAGGATMLAGAFLAVAG